MYVFHFMRFRIYVHLRDLGLETLPVLRDFVFRNYGIWNWFSKVQWDSGFTKILNWGRKKKIRFFIGILDLKTGIKGFNPPLLPRTLWTKYHLGMSMFQNLRKFTTLSQTRIFFHLNLGIRSTNCKLFSSQVAHCANTGIHFLLVMQVHEIVFFFAFE